jgi:hypothetical protein
MSDPARFLEIVYDPTIGEASLKFDHMFRRALGMYLSISRKGHVNEVLRNWPVKDVRFILEVEVQTAARVAGLVFDADLARVDRPTNMDAFIRRQLYKPEYQVLA